MIKNYFKIALRNFKRHKLFTFINVIGLSIGISAALVIYLIAKHDFTFNNFFPNEDRIYRVVTNYSDSGQPGYNSGVCGPMPEAVRTEVTGVEQSTPIFTLYECGVQVPDGTAKGKVFKKQDNVMLTNDNYFKLLSYQWLAGSANKALTEPFKVVLTSDQAKLYFPELSYSQMLGKELVYEDTIKTTVSGIVQSLGTNTDFKFHDFISYTTATHLAGLKGQLQLTEWQSTNSASQLFVKLSPGTSTVQVEKQINKIYNKNHSKSADDLTQTQSYSLQPLSDLHFNSHYGSFDTGAVANRNTLYGLLLIAAFLLTLGCINFINLSTAQGSQRAKEIGIRKTVGSTRFQLIAQLLSETFVITLLAVLIAMLAAPYILNIFSDFISPDVKFNILAQPGILLFLLMLTVVISLLSGIYPAVILSGYKPAMVIKNQAYTNSGKTRNAWLRKLLITTQFVIAQFFIMATLLVSKQIYYALHKDLGFKKDAIVYMSAPWKVNDISLRDVLVNKLRLIPQVELVSLGGAAPSSGSRNSTVATYKDGKKEIKIDVQQKFADENYLKIYQLKLLAGRYITTADTSKALLINENYAHALGFKNPRSAVGIQLDYFGHKVQVVGVLADFHQVSLRSPITPLAVVPAKGAFRTNTFHIALKPQTPGGHEWKQAIAAMEKSWQQVYPGEDFEYNFFDESLARFYESEQHTSNLLTCAAVLSIIISCLGLLGLAVYTTNTRTKEIGVRKVLGATVRQVVTLLSTELVLLVLLAFVLVAPVAWWAMHLWIQNFAERTAISWWIFVLSGGAMLLTALLTLSSQTIKAATANPVKSLRTE